MRAVLRIGENGEVVTLWEGNIAGESKKKLTLMGPGIKRIYRAGAQIKRNRNHVCLTMEKEIFDRIIKERSRYTVNIS